MKQPKGFIALMSALVISAVLLLIITGGSLSGFYTRMDALNGEYKERSYALAQACVSETLLALANDPAYAGGATTTVSGSGQCYTGPIAKSGSLPSDTYTFRTRSYVSGAYSSIDVTASVGDLSITKQAEVPTY